MKVSQLIASVVIAGTLSFAIVFGLARHNLVKGNLDRAREECRAAASLSHQPMQYLHVLGSANESERPSRSSWELRVKSFSDQTIHVLISSISPVLADGSSSVLIKAGGEQSIFRTAESFQESISLKHAFSFGVLGREPGAGDEERVEFHYPVEGRSRVVQADGATQFLGRKSHGEGMTHAVDIVADLGSLVRNGRRGVVVHVVDGYPDAGCYLPELKHKSNVVVVRHEDGSEALYGHLKENSIEVQVGELVVPGQAIAKVGNSGMSALPHLHLHVGGLTESGYRTIPLQFHGCRAKSGFAPKIGDVDC